MEIVTVAAAIAASNILCFIVGAKVGQAVKNGEKIDTPHPVQAVKDFSQNIKVEKERDRDAVILKNIESYDGTEMGQVDVPR